MCQVVEFLNCIPNLEYAALEELVRENEIDGESLLLLTQVPMLRLNIYPSFPDTKNVKFLFHISPLRKQSNRKINELLIQRFTFFFPHVTNTVFLKHFCWLFPVKFKLNTYMRIQNRWLNSTLATVQIIRFFFIKQLITEW